VTIAEKFSETHKVEKETYKYVFRLLDLSNRTDKKLLYSAFLHIPFIEVDVEEVSIYATKSLIRDFWKTNSDKYASSLAKVSGIPRNKCKTFLKMLTSNFIVFPDLSINVVVDQVQTKSEQENKTFMDAYLALIGE